MKKRKIGGIAGEWIRNQRVDTQVEWVRGSDATRVLKEHQKPHPFQEVALEENPTRCD